MTTPAVDRALAELRVAQDAHAELLSSKFAALGKRLGIDYVPTLEQDPDVVAAYARIERAEKALATAERAARRARR